MRRPRDPFPSQARGGGGCRSARACEPGSRAAGRRTLRRSSPREGKLRTVKRLERGQSTSLETLVRSMLGLGLASHLETLLPAPGIRPVERLRLEGSERERARPAKKRVDKAPFKWGDGK